MTTESPYGTDAEIERLNRKADELLATAKASLEASEKLLLEYQAVEMRAKTLFAGGVAVGIAMTAILVVVAFGS